ncbi:MAG: ATPase P [Lachnospiraceae bacterium]|nr:ATPase P [Lachnospiraceae bacterium]
MVYALLLIVLIAILVIMMSTKLTKGSSCCGTKEPPVKRIKPSDSDTSHYPHTYELKVEGMVCVNCARRVENAFISQGDMIAKADAMSKEVRLWSKRELSRQEAASIVREAGYTLLDIK